jgi:predicted dehydrogenase
MNKIIVVEGMGDVVDRFYGPALHRLKEKLPDLEAICIDDTGYWTPDNERIRRGTLAKLSSWGIEFIDKSGRGSLEQRERYFTLRDAQVDAVIVATKDDSHISVAEHWLEGNCLQICIEKPLTDKASKADNLVSRRDDRVWAFDHYRARVHEQLGDKSFRRNMYVRLAGLKKMRFYYLEDRSGTDLEFLDREREQGRSNLNPNKNGPIEILGRQDSLQEGLILDMMSHMPALLKYFGKMESIEVDLIRAGKYRGVDFDDAKETEIRNETFAAVELRFHDHDDSLVAGEAYVGKGIRGSTEHDTLKGNIKLLELEGHNKKKYQFDFQNNQVLFVDSTATTIESNLQDHPHDYLLEDLLSEEDDREPLNMLLIEARDILNRMEDMRDKIKGKDLPTYLLGQKDMNDNITRHPPFLEDLLERGQAELPVIFKRPDR